MIALIESNTLTFTRLLTELDVIHELNGQTMNEVETTSKNFSCILILHLL